MPGLSFLLLGVLQAVVTTTSSLCASRFLVTVTNETNGVEIRIFRGLSSNVDLTSYVQRELNGHFLSTECGEAFRKCNQPFVISVNNSEWAETSIVIFPLANALGLLALNVGTKGFDDELVVKDLSQYGCHPTAVYHIRNSHYIVCSNAETSYIRLLELKLNATHLKQSTTSDLEYLYTESIHNLTNSLHIDLPSRSGSYIYFATGYTILYFKPLDYLIGQLSVDLQELGCSATALDYVGGWEMIVYCEDNRAVYVDINSELVVVYVEYAKEGRPYVCPNSDVYLAVNTEGEYIQYAFWSTKQVKNYEMSISNFDNGICLGTEDVTLFTFTDRERGTRLLNASGSSVHLLSGTPCTNYPCQPLLVLQDRYLVIREKKGGIWYISLFDSHNNFSLALEAKHSRADLIAIAGSKSIVNCTELRIFSEIGSTSQVLRPSPSPSIDRQFNTHILTLISLISAGVIMVLIALWATCITVFCWVMYVRKRKTSALVSSVQHFGFEQCQDITGQSSLVAGIAIEETVCGGGFKENPQEDESSSCQLDSKTEKEIGQGGSDGADLVTDCRQSVSMGSSLDSNSESYPLHV